MKRAAVALVVGLFVVLAVAWGARYREGNRAMLDCDAAITRKDAIDAVLTARIAASSKCPLCPAPARGYARLEGIAKDAESRADDVVAFAAFRAMRAAALATDDDSHRERADQELARIGRKLDAARTTGGTPTAAAAEDRLRAALEHDDVPKLPAFAVLAAVAICFLVAAGRFAKSGRRVPELPLAAAGAAVAALGLLYF